MRKTKIVCTLGPASTKEEIIHAMLKAGMNVARVNFSHGDHASHGKTIDLFRGVRDSDDARYPWRRAWLRHYLRESAAGTQGRRCGAD